MNDFYFFVKNIGLTIDLVHVMILLKYRLIDSVHVMILLKNKKSINLARLLGFYLFFS